MILIEFVALGVVAAFFSISDWKRREVDLRVVLLAYCAATVVNAGLIFSGRAAIDKAAAFSIILLSGVMLPFWRLGLLAFGDVISIPAMLLMLLTVPSSSLVGGPLTVLLYFVIALAFVAITSLAKNLRNNLQYRSKLYGSLQQKLHLMLFCYYGDSSMLKHAFKYDDDDLNNNDKKKKKKKVRRDYDREEYYNGKEKTWLVPGLPLLSGFLPATIVLMVLVWLLQ